MYNRRGWPLVLTLGAGGIAVLALALGLGLWRGKDRLLMPQAVPPVLRAQFEAAYTQPLPPPEGALSVYHLGHSLVGQKMPQILAQMAGHDHASQLGWGTSLAQHHKGPAAVFGYEKENDHAFHREAREAIASGEYDAVVFTEMVELKDAIAYHGSPAYLAIWAKEAREANPDVRLYLYETWHPLTDPAGWEARIANDLAALWEGEVLAGALAHDAPAVYLIPGGQVLAAAARAAQNGEIEGVTQRESFFALDDKGQQDPIHLNDLGAYVIALTHYAVLYQRSPQGLPHRFSLEDGSILFVEDETAEALQRLVWQVVQTIPRTGMSPS